MFTLSMFMAVLKTVALVTTAICAVRREFFGSVG